MVVVQKAFKSLADVLAAQPDLVEFFYNDTKAPHAKAGGGTPVPPERSNWIDEQRAWRGSAMLFDLSHHMVQISVRGPDAMRLLSGLGVNSFANFVPGKAKQFIACNHEGFVIGETLMYCHAADDFELVSGTPLLNWVEYNARTGGYNVTIERDNNTVRNPTGKRQKFRYQLEGPNAPAIFAEVCGGEAPVIPFFSTAKVRIAGVDCVVLRHGMAGHQGVEISGPYDQGETVRAALLKSGAKQDLIEGGALSYFSALGESGWMASPFPAIFTSPKLQAYREWLPADAWEAGAQLGGSFVSKRLEDYYVTPWDLGIEKLVKFDHDFIGREALERLAAAPRRTRRTLIWNKEDVLKIYGSMLEPGVPYKYLRLPLGALAYQQYDEVRNKDGQVIGHSTYVGYTANEAKVISLVMINLDHAEEGNELVLTWGEPNGGSRKGIVERHRQTDVHVTVAPAPFARVVQKLKHSAMKSQ